MMKKRRIFQKEDNKSQKEKHDNLGDDEKEQFRKYKKKRKKVIRDNLGNDENEQLRKIDKKERCINVYRLQMKEAVFLLVYKCVV